MARYVERYVYDEVGNLLRMAHRSADPAHGGWTRDYLYREPSLLEPARHSNRLTATAPARAVTSPQRFCYDEQGNTTAMPEIPVLRWDQYDRLHATARQAAAGMVPETTYYVYDAAGQRARKVTERGRRRQRHPQVRTHLRRPVRGLPRIRRRRRGHPGTRDPAASSMTSTGSPWSRPGPPAPTAARPS